MIDTRSEGNTKDPYGPTAMSGRSRRSSSAQSGHVLITGGAGFIGTNVADRFLSMGRDVLIFDNLSRPKVQENLRWLFRKHNGRFQAKIADIRDFETICETVEKAKMVFHFAAQVAVTTSLVDPIEDFDVNLRGTINLLEALRRLDDPPPLLFTSTNKVYGGLEEIQLKKNSTRYEPVDGFVKFGGIDETHPVDFCSPYGCSKGGADFYTLDYARTYGLKAVVFRMSCIYGPHQFGTEDQGWVAHFLIKALEGDPITIYGDGFQVRDLLFVGDLVDAMLLAMENMPSVSGQAFNIGGGPSNTLSLVDLLRIIEKFKGRRPEVSHSGWRRGDQRYYVSNCRKFEKATGWEPRTGVEEGVRQLYTWLIHSRAHRKSPPRVRPARI